MPLDLFVFAFDLDLPGARLEDFVRTLSTDERARAARFVFERDRRRFIAAHGQMREILAQQLACAARDIKFEHGPYGKPALDQTQYHRCIHFSLSRSEEIGTLALQLDHELGIDIERIRPFSDALAIAARLFSPAEHQALSALPQTEHDAAFVEYWTRKEAIVKSIGVGLSQPLNSFTLAPAQEADTAPITLEVQGRTITRWLVNVPAPGEHFVCVVATSAPPGTLHLARWT